MSKTATIYLFDLGSSMNDFINDSDETALELGLRYFRDRAGDDIVDGRKTVFNGVIAAKYTEDEQDDETENLYPDSQEIIDLKNLQMSDVGESFMGKMTTSTSDQRDVFRTLSLCVKRMTDFCRKLKYTKTIVVITDGKAPIKASESDGIVSGNVISDLVKNNITLKVLGIGFSDDGDMEEHDYSNEYQKIAEKEWRSICEEVEKKDPDNQSVVVGSTEIYQALQEPTYRATKASKLTAVPDLTLGDVSKKSRAFEIPVALYSCIRKIKPASGTLVYEDGDGKIGRALRITENFRPNPAYLKNENEQQEDIRPDPEKEDRMLPVDDSELVNGYIYGHELVPAPENVDMFSPTKPGFQIAGTVVMELGQDLIYDPRRLQRWYLMSPTDYVIPQTNNESLLANFRARVHALKAENMCYVAYLGRSVMADPRMVALFPFITEDPRNVCLLLSDLPLSEDIRPYKFPSLLNPKTKGGKPLPADNKQTPTDEMLEVMNQVVDKMNLMTADEDRDGNAREWASPWDVHNPLYHRVKQVLKHKAIEQSETADEIPDKLPMQTAYQHTPRRIIADCEEELDKLEELFDLKKVEKVSSVAEKRKADEEFGGDHYKARKTGLNLDELL